MQYFQQPPDPRTFGNPHIPEPKGSGWFGWLLMIIATAIGSFLLGKMFSQSQIEPPLHETNKEDLARIAEVPAMTSQTIDNEEDKEEQKQEQQDQEDNPKTFDELEDDVIERFIEDFENVSLAEKLWCKKQFQENSYLIEWYPELAEKLGLSTPTDNQL